jgi:hypothetical protein
MKFAALVVTLIAWCHPAVAQQAGNKSTPASEHSEDVAKQDAKSQPPAELQSMIKALSGRWSLNVKFEPNPEMPNGFVSTGEETWRSGPGGYTLLQEERLPTPSGDVFLLGVIWWDTKTKSLHGMECNNQLPYGCDLKGALNDITMSWDGKEFLINESETHDGKKTMWHEGWRDITSTSYTQTGDVEVPGGATTRFFTTKATRMKDASQ